MDAAAQLPAGTERDCTPNQGSHSLEVPGGGAAPRGALPCKSRFKVRALKKAARQQPGDNGCAEGLPAKESL